MDSVALGRPVSPHLRELLKQIQSRATEADLAALADVLRSYNESGRNGKELFQLAEPVLVGPDASWVSKSRVLALIELAIHYFLAGAPERALGPSSLAAGLANATGDIELRARSLKVHGTTLMETGNLPEAVEAMAEAMELARSTGNVRQEIGTWNNLGVCHMYACHFADAIACFEMAIALAGDAPELGGVKELGWANVAFASLQTNDLRRGIRAARQALALPMGPTSVEMTNRVVAENYYVRLLLELDMVDEAKAHAANATRVAEAAGTARARIMADMAQGLVEVRDGDVESGLGRLKDALERSRRGQPGMLQDCLIAAIKGYEAAGQANVALVYMRELARGNKDRAARQVLLHHRRHLSSVDDRYDLSATAEQARHESALKERLQDREVIKAMTQMLEQESVAAELHDDTTGEHCYRVGRLASLLAREYGVDEHTCFLIDIAARMHDIGKLSVPDSILLKPGKLTPAERQIMEQHTTAGAAILSKSSIPQMHVAEEIAGGHHEKWDGAGYPKKLRGEEIPLAARITALADVYDALTHVRPYKTAWSADASLAEIASLRGSHFDPELTDVFLPMMERLRREHANLDAFLAAEARNSPYITARAKVAEALKAKVNTMTVEELVARR